MDGSQVVFDSLKGIRDIGSLSSRNTSKGALIPETFNVFKNVRNKIDVVALRNYIVVKNGLNKPSYENRRKIWNAIYYRYLTVNPEWIGQSLSVATKKGINSPEYLSLAYLYYALRDRLTFEFAIGPMWEKWQRKTTNIDREDVLVFLESHSSESQEIKRWHESTRIKLASNALTAFRDFGILRGQKKKYIQRPSIAPETIYHLLCVLSAEDKEGRAIIDAPDWRLFLWDESDVLNALGNLSQMGWIRFEKVGRTVILQMVRLPEVFK
jgi:hypothetical protein